MEVALLAHEIINPLNIIIGCAELTKMENLPTNVSQHINEIIKQSLWCCEILKTEINNKQNTLINIQNILLNIVNDIKKHPLYSSKHLKIYFKRTKP